MSARFGVCSEARILWSLVQGWSSVNDYGSVRGGVKRGRLDSQRAVPFPGRGADGMQADEPPSYRTLSTDSCW